MDGEKGREDWRIQKFKERNKQRKRQTNSGLTVCGIMPLLVIYSV